VQAAFDPILGLDARLRVDLRVERPPAHETLNVLVPWSSRRFQFTSKQCALPARGEVVVDGRRYPFAEDTDAFACLDHGRGVWPYRTRWNWGNASGRRAGRTLGLNLGGQWTDGTGTTENGLVIDGRLHKIHEPVRWEYAPRDLARPWRVRSPRVDLTFTPAFERRAAGNFGLLSARLGWCFGMWSGVVIDDDERPIEIDRLRGWAEEVHARW
jgi:hypothetical protein